MRCLRKDNAGYLQHAIIRLRHLHRFGATIFYGNAVEVAYLELTDADDPFLC